MDAYEAIRKRRSVRAFLAKEIPDDVMKKLYDALRFAPSACNYQPWHFIFVTDATLRQDVAAASNNQAWMADAPVTVVACGCADLAYPRMGGYWNSADVDVAIAVDHLTLAAAAEGLGTCWIGAFEEAKVKPMLNVPQNVKIVAMTPLGYPASTGLMRPVNDTNRKPPQAVFSHDMYDNPML